MTMKIPSHFSSFWLLEESTQSDRTRLTSLEGIEDIETIVIFSSSHYGGEGVYFE